MKALTFYHAPSGSIFKRSLVADDYTPPPGDWIVGASDPDSQYVSGGALAPRTTGTITASKAIIENNGTDSAVITCPNPCWLRVNGAFVQANGTYSVTATEVGTVLVRLAGQYRGEVTVTVGDAIDMTFEADPRWVALKGATPTQIDNWLTTNVTNITQARTVLRILILAVRKLIRS